MSQIIKPGTGGGGGSGIIQTIAGDIGSITGANVTIFANNATNNSGASVLFNNAGTVSTLEVSSSQGDTLFGKNTGNISASAIQENTGFGENVLSNIDTAVANSGFGAGSVLFNLTSGSYNSCFGFGSGSQYNSSESGNICIRNIGQTGESNTIRIGTDGTESPMVQNRCFIAGINGNINTNPQNVTIDSVTGQIAVAQQISFQAYLSVNQTFVAGSVDDQIIYDNAVSNVGSAYDPTTGLFTAPKTAFYCFSLVTWFTDLISAVGATMAEVAFTGNAQSLRLEQIGNGSFSQGTDLFISSTWSMSMIAGDQIKIKPFVDGVGDYEIGGGGVSPADFNTASTFSGFSIN